MTIETCQKEIRYLQSLFPRLRITIYDGNADAQKQNDMVRVKVSHGNECYGLTADMCLTNLCVEELQLQVARIINGIRPTRSTVYNDYYYKLKATFGNLEDSQLSLELQ